MRVRVRVGTHLDGEVHGLLGEAVDVPVGRASLGDAVGAECDAHDVLQHALLAEDALLGPQLALVARELRVALLGGGLLHALLVRGRVSVRARARVRARVRARGRGRGRGRVRGRVRSSPP